MIWPTGTFNFNFSHSLSYQHLFIYLEKNRKQMTANVQGHHNNTKRVVSLGYFHIKKRSGRSYIFAKFTSRSRRSYIKKGLKEAFQKAIVFGHCCWSSRNKIQWHIVKSGRLHDMRRTVWLDTGATPSWNKQMVWEHDAWWSQHLPLV